MDYRPSALNNELDLLAEYGVIKDGEQVRPVSREDLQKLIKANGGSLEYLRLSGLDMSGIDLRGLNLDKGIMNGCNLEGALAMPLIILRGAELPVGDLAYEWILSRWPEGQELNIGECVVPTVLSQLFLNGSNLTKADFRWADLSESFLNAANLEQTAMYGANLSKASLRWTQLQKTDLRNANLEDANLEGATIRDADLRGATLRGTKLVGVRFDTPLLEGIHWGDNYLVPEEIEGKFSEAGQVYRALKQAHQNAGEFDKAGQFHYREEISFRNSTLTYFKARSHRQRSEGVVPFFWSALRNGGLRFLLRWLYLLLIVEPLFGYGERPWRVVRFALVAILGFSLAYFEGTGFALSSVAFVEFLRQFGNALYFSAVSFTALGYGEWVVAPPGWTRYLGVVETLVGVFSIALFLITFTRRWTR